ncbi:MAG: hypothetical protein HC837_19390 [Chloroflexaceae bacterium]|nr:hypothetical protein [Chloroflexaceae bacterium]
MARPWSPQAFYRLTCYYSCIPIETGYVYGSLAFRLFAPLGILWALLTRNGGLLEMCCWEAIGWAAFLLAQKPATLSGAVPLQYDVPNERSLYTSLFLERITAVIRRQRPDV